MSERLYQLIITNENNANLRCFDGFEYFESGEYSVSVDFDPTTALCDLLDIVDYKKRSDNVSGNYYLKSDYLNHPFFVAERTRDMYDSDIHSGLRFSWFYDFIVELRELCEQERNISLNQFEVFKQYFITHFTYKIEFQEDNPYYKDYVFCEMNNMAGIADCEFTYRGIEENKDFTLREMLDFHGDTPFRHNYMCYSLVDIMCSVWHYLILHEYKFSRCKHCGKYFATQTLKKIYCDRNSPYPQFEQHNCEQAVRNIKQKLARRKKSAYTYISTYYSKAINLFFNEYAQIKDTVDACSSVENLKTLETFLSKDNVRENWYKAEYM